MTLLNVFWLTSAPSAIPSTLDLSEEDIRPDAAVVASAYVVAPGVTPSSFFLSDADISPSSAVVAAA